jgi:ribosome-binding protein aMBF1 (putative translation factor)
MSAAVKTRHINIRLKARTPVQVIHSIKKQFSNYILEDEEENVDWFKTDLHKEIAANMNPGDYLRNFREAHGITQKDLAEKIGVRVNYLSDLETGQRAISRKNAKRFAEIFNVTAGVFV